MSPRAWRLLALVAIVVAAGAAYSNSFHAPFVFDDEEALVDNDHLPHWALTAPPNSALTSRPIASLSFALSYAAGKLDPAPYRRLNLALHVLAACALYGCIRKTLTSPYFAGRREASAAGLAFGATLLWTLHPLQSEAILYVTQRTELLMGLFYLLTLYTSLRAWDGPRSRLWQIASCTFCLLGMLSKEVMISAPLVVPAHDWIFRGLSVRQLAAKRGWYYAGLLASAVPLVALTLASDRGKSVGLLHGIGVVDYLAAQGSAIVGYLTLALWPANLCIDHGSWIYGPWNHYSLTSHLPASAFVAFLLALAIAAARRRSWPFFAGVWFFGILAPTSSVLPIVTEMAAERRMYLPLAALVVPAVVATYTACRRAPWIALVLLVSVATAYGVRTERRVEDYSTPIRLWTDTVAKCPGNARAAYNLGVAYYAAGHREPAMSAWRQALENEPAYPIALNNLGNALREERHYAEAEAILLDALGHDRQLASAHHNLGLVYYETDRFEQARQAYEAALAIDAQRVDTWNNLGNTCVRLDQAEPALAAYRKAREIDPRFKPAYLNAATVYTVLGRYADAERELAAVLRFDPQDPQVRDQLAEIQRKAGRPPAR